MDIVVQSLHTATSHVLHIETQRVEDVLPGNLNYYQLSKKGAAAISVSENKAEPKQPKGLAQDLAALWFSCMDHDHSRKRLKNSELRKLFGAPKGGNVIHVAQETEESTVFRLFISDVTI